MKLDIELLYGQVDLLKQFANQVNKIPIEHFKGVPSDTLWELNLDTLEFTSICTKRDILEGKYYPNHKSDYLYCFRYKEKDAFKRFKIIIKVILQTKTK